MNKVYFSQVFTMPKSKKSKDSGLHMLLLTQLDNVEWTLTEEFPFLITVPSTLELKLKENMFFLPIMVLSFFEVGKREK